MDKRRRIGALYYRHRLDLSHPNPIIAAAVAKPYATYIKYSWPTFNEAFCRIAVRTAGRRKEAANRPRDSAIPVRHSHTEAAKKLTANKAISTVITAPKIYCLRFA